MLQALALVFLLPFVMACTPVIENHAILAPPPMPASMDLPADPVIEVDLSAGALLERAFMDFHTNKWKSSIHNFTQAIGTGNLNDAGRALAYWHIGQCYIRLDDPDNASEALFSFVTIGEDILAGERRYAVSEDGDFATQFDLEGKIEIAKSYYMSLWKERTGDVKREGSNGESGRSE